MIDVQLIALVARIGIGECDIIIAKVSNHCLIAVEIWQLGGVQRQRIWHRRRRSKHHIDRGDLIGVRIRPLDIGDGRRGRAPYFPKIKHHTLAEDGVHRQAHGIDVVQHHQTHQLLTFAVGEIQVVLAKAINLLAAIGIRQVGTLEL